MFTLTTKKNDTTRIYNSSIISANNGIFRVKTERGIYLFYLIIELKNNLYNLYIYIYIVYIGELNYLFCGGVVEKIIIH